MSISFTDQQVLQIVKHLYKTMEKEQNQKQLDLDHLDTFKRKQIKPLYPHKTILQNGVKKLQKHSCEDICCNLSSGSTCCSFFKNIEPPDNVYQQFGLGMNVYFNFMKHFAGCLIFLAIFAALAVGLSCFISTSNGFDPISNYQNFFFSTTMGSFSSGYFRCKYSVANQTQNGTYVTTFDLNCPQGEIFQFGPVMTTNSQENLMNCEVERSRFRAQSQGYYLQPSQYTKAQDKSCTNTDCKITINIKSQSSINLVSYPYSCINPAYDLFGNSKPIQIRILTYIFVGFDLLITLGLMFFICSEKDGENKEVEHFKKFQLSLKDFSVKVKGFDRKRFDEEFHEFVDSISQRERDFVQKIIQIKVPDDEKYLQEVATRRERYQELFGFMERNFFDSMINPEQYSNSQQFIENTFVSFENYLSFKKQLIVLVQGYKKVGQRDRTKSQEISIYLVLNCSADVTKLKRMRQSFCCGKYLVTKSGKQFQLEEAPIPDMLQWMNKTKWTFLRVLISWILTLVIVVGSYLLFGYVQWHQKNLLAKYQFSIDCGVIYPNTTFTEYNSTLYDKNSTQYANCYCSSNYFSFNITDQVSMHCTQWKNSYILYLLIPLIISLGLVLYNLIVSIIFRKLSEFQSHFFVSDQMFSYIIKRSFILIMNMGLIIVLLNFDYFQNSTSLSPQQLFFLFQGQYSDITSDWYLSIGSIIVLTMIFNISYPFMELFMTSVLKCFRKCVDKRCWSRKTTQKYKMDYINLYSSDVYPIEQRYAIIVSIFWILMIFGCVMPVLYIIVAVSMLLLVIIDKVLLFKFFKTPINFDESLHKKVIKTLYLGLMLHLVASAFFLSQPNLVPNNSSFTQFSTLATTSNQRLNAIIQTYYIIPYVGLFLLMLLYAIFKQTIVGLLSTCNKKTQRTSLYKVTTLSNFYESLTQYQLAKLKVMVEKEICRLTTLKRQKSFTTINHPTEYSLICINTSSNQKIQNSLQIDTQLTIYTKTLNNILKMIDSHQQGKASRTTKLIGMPGYQMLLNEIQAEKDKKMLQLDSVLEQIIVRKR